MGDATWRWVGESALLRRFENTDVSVANVSALQMRRDLAALAAVEVLDIVAGARSVLVTLRAGDEPSPELLTALDREPRVGDGTPGYGREVAVRYGGEDGPDLDDVAAHVGRSPDEVVARHAASEYVVAFIGFSPGFPYLLGMPAELATPRLDSPRTRVAPGSVGVGGPYTGIYPSATPGGWRVIGRADVELFDATREPPALLAPGDRVRFVAR
jgi:KipI family sensor histidine kinase inhibitor